MRSDIWNELRGSRDHDDQYLCTGMVGCEDHRRRGEKPHYTAEDTSCPSDERFLAWSCCAVHGTRSLLGDPDGENSPIRIREASDKPEKVGL